MAEELNEDAPVQEAKDMHSQQKDDFLCFGFAPDVVLGVAFDLPGARDYLRQCDLEHGLLTQARKARGQSGKYAGYHIPSKRQCDFCGRYLTGVEYDILKDGRERCAECSATTVDRRAHV